MVGTAVTPEGQQIPPPTFTRPAPSVPQQPPAQPVPQPPVTRPVAQGGPVPPQTPNDMMRDPDSGVQYPVDPRYVFPGIVDNNAFQRYMGWA
jgi:hypothetical protein